MRAGMKPSPSKLHSDKVQPEAHKEVDLKKLNKPGKLTPGRLKNPFLTGELQHIQVYKTLREVGSSSATFMEGNAIDICATDSHEIYTLGSSEDKLKSAALFENDNLSSEIYDAWIFPDHAKRLCITTGSKQIMDLVGSCGIQERVHKSEKRCQFPENVEKAIRVAIMIAFGTLVLLTRQRKPRYELVYGIEYNSSLHHPQGQNNST
ncbi:uncharacterized protein LOC127797214 isoform X2 [Diospyros lotus]|uniref:uncharacterized protein LOC127797214 isoform X2 n=1 Tax=Diospyros lotus TaxID=55363 RepID=UPI00225577F2|nr:uncharacterized protein LOC127797214 isoform X2 [Diospyros lotus]